MNRADPLAELLAPFVGAAANAQPEATPAKAANPANRKHPCGLQPDSGGCEGLRIPAKAAGDSQTFAGVRNPQNRPASEQRRGSSQNSQDSQGYPADCTSGKAGAAPQARPYHLSRAEADAAHAEPWDDATIGRFTVRALLFLRRGLNATDADDLAERLHLRDVRGDERRMCVECTHLRGGRCRNHKAAGLLTADVSRELATTLQRCAGFGLQSAPRGGA